MLDTDPDHVLIGDTGHLRWAVSQVYAGEPETHIMSQSII